MSTTIQISIFLVNEPTIEFDFLSEKLNWTNLVTLIESTRHVDSPVILYYKKDNVIETLENQLQLESLLLVPEIKGLCFYAQKDLVTENVYILPGHAFARLTQLVDQHKDIISSSNRLARWVGILASFIAQDTTDHHFNYEFKVLDALIERKTQKSKFRQEQAENPDQQAPCEALFGLGGGHHGGRHSGRGEFFGGRGGFFGGRGGFFGGRGGHHGGFFGGRGGHHGGFFGSRGHHGGRHHKDLGETSQGESSDEFRGHGKHHGRFGKHSLGEEFGGRGPFDRHHGPFGPEFHSHHHGSFGPEAYGHHSPFGEGFGGKFSGGKHGGYHGAFGEEFGGKHGPFGGKHGDRHHRAFDEKFGSKFGGGKHGSCHYRGEKFDRCGDRGKSSAEESSGDEITLCQRHHGKKRILII